MKHPKPKYKVGQVVQQLDYSGNEYFYAKVTVRRWDAEEQGWAYQFDLGFDCLLEDQMRPLTRMACVVLASPKSSLLEDQMRPLTRKECGR